MEEIPLVRGWYFKFLLSTNQSIYQNWKLNNLALFYIDRRVTIRNAECNNSFSRWNKMRGAVSRSIFMLVGYFSANGVACRHVRVHLVWLNSPLSQLRKLCRAGEAISPQVETFCSAPATFHFGYAGGYLSREFSPFHESEKFIPPPPCWFNFTKEKFAKKFEIRFVFLIDPKDFFLFNKILLSIIFTCCKFSIDRQQCVIGTSII